VFLDPRQELDNTGVDPWTLTALRRDATDSVLVPAVTLFTDQRGTGHETRTFYTGAHLVVCHLAIRVRGTTGVRRDCLLYILVQHVAVSACQQQTVFLFLLLETVSGRHRLEQ